MKYPFQLNCNKCGGVAFYMNHKPVPHELLISSDCLLLDGTVPKPQSAAICGTCGRSPGDSSDQVGPRHYEGDEA